MAAGPGLYSRVVAVLKVGLPLIALALLAGLFLAPREEERGVVFSPGEIRLRFSVRGSNVSRTFKLFVPPPTPSKPTTPVVTDGFGRQRLNVVLSPVEPGAPTTVPVKPSAAALAAVTFCVPIVLIVTPFEPVPVIG